ncbi:MAG TPA: glycerol-3-phosphate 1-O-acyltransferase PlsB [Candidatus Binatia bacterium]|nr:glycerol-3-phosphate 1-O-acyltransferase PlsB [Candidatus Binatia bacterium]
MLTDLLFTLAWWLRKPMLRLVRYRVAPDDVKARLNLDPARPVCFVLPQRSWTDLFVLDRICRDLGLPRPQRTGAELPTLSRPGYLYLSVLLESRLASQRAPGRRGAAAALIQRAVADPQFDVQLVPVSIFWGREPEKETSLFKLLFADSVQAGAIRKLLILVVNGRNVLASFGLPVPFRAYMGETGDPARSVRKLMRALHFHFLRMRTATLGPSLVRRAVVIQGLLGSRGVRLAMEQEAKDRGQTLEQVRRRAQKIAEEIAADYSNATISFFEKLVGYVTHRIFKGVELRGLERVRELAQSHVMIYLPSHRSHVDYLMVSYLLYHAGLVPPHIAAGVNLNMPIIGPLLLRRSGAFFMRRKFTGDRLYIAVFRAYVDSLIQRGYSIEFFPEGGRSRTGRLLAPKTGLMAMVVESALRQRIRKVVVVPVHIGYDRVLEVNSYLKELRGAQKQKESVQGLLKAVPMLRRSYGKVYLNFGEPIRLEEFADARLPAWREQLLPQSDARPEGFSRFVSQLALETMRRINAAAMATPAGLVGLALLAAPQKAAAEADLIEQIGQFIALLQGRPYSPDQHLPITDPREALAWAEPVIGTSRIPHAWGDLIVAESKVAVRMTYARNNIHHLVAMPSLIANFFRSRFVLPEDALVTGCRLLYPFLASQFFLRWSADEAEVAVREWIEVMVRLGLLVRGDSGQLRRPDLHSPAFGRLVTLGRVMGETFERYGMSALLLSQERKLGRIERARFEEDCRLFAERMAVLTGRNAPEFFDSALFKGYVSTLIEMGLVTERGDGTLEVDERIDRIAERSMELLSGEAQQTVLQILARRPV